MIKAGPSLCLFDKLSLGIDRGGNQQPRSIEPLNNEFSRHPLTKIFFNYFIFLNKRDKIKGEYVCAS